MSWPNPHMFFITWLADKFGWKVNHKHDGRRYSPTRDPIRVSLPVNVRELSGIKSRHIIPDLISDDVIVEAEVTANKSKYHALDDDRKKILFIGIQAMSAFDEIYFYSIERSRPPYTVDNKPWTLKIEEMIE